MMLCLKVAKGLEVAKVCIDQFLFALTKFWVKWVQCMLAPPAPEEMNRLAGDACAVGLVW